MKDPFPIFDHAGVGEATLSRIRGLIVGHERLLQELAWCASRNPPRPPLFSVAQDEFSHDVVVDYEQNVFLSYEVT